MVPGISIMPERPATDAVTASIWGRSSWGRSGACGELAPGGNPRLHASALNGTLSRPCIGQIVVLFRVRFEIIEEMFVVSDIPEILPIPFA